jgi:hypothetical protein
MTGRERVADLEMLSRMTARLAGRDPDQRVTSKIAETTVFDDVMWRYPDLVLRAESAYAVLSRGALQLADRSD